LEVMGVELEDGSLSDALAACGRGKSDVALLLDYCGVPLLFARVEGFIALTLFWLDGLRKVG
jgi:hypothetical protein